MKKMMAMVFFLLVSIASAKTEQIVNVYNWSGYIPSSVLVKFEQETGVRINYSTYDSNEMLYDKLKSDQNIGYDIVAPSSYILQRMMQEGMLQKLNYAKLTNVKYLDKALLNESFDPNNQYSLPYLWGTTGLIVNRNFFSESVVRQWSDLWAAQFRRQITMVDDMRDVFSVGLASLGYSINDRDPDHIKQAYQKLKDLMPNVLAFAASGSQQMYVNEDSKIGMINSGDAMMVLAENSNYFFVYPKDRQIIWMDNMALPSNAPHLENAYKFMNFVMRPDIAKMISEGVGYSSPNQAAVQLMTKEQQADPILNPKKEQLSHAEVESDIGLQANRLMLKYWELLKLGA
jgi:spermidine/putrescine transport system substrate-binding protein